MTELAQPIRRRLGDWLPIAYGLGAMYVPTFVDLARIVWRSEEQGHGPIILAVVAWLAWDRRQAWLDADTPRRPLAGGFLLAVGLLFYILGRSQDIIIFEVGSLIPVLAGSLLIQRGWGGVRPLWFALLFIIFMVPVPQAVIDAITGALKQNVSVLAENILYSAGYPIARSGVVLTIGQYQLLVADACSGLNSMFSLSALGLLYLYLTNSGSTVRNAVLLAAILPTAFVANVVRVMVLVLVTYYLGDEAGQGFVHGFAGMILFLIALVTLFAVDGTYGLISRIVGGKRGR
jgi:exosortase B